MMKRISALLLCVVMLSACFVSLAGCGSSDDEDKGQYINAYLANDVYDLDPANTYNNEALANIVGLMFDTLFKLDSDGQVQKSLVSKYWITENDDTDEYIMYLRLKNTCWSDGTAIAADNVVYAWKRLLEVDSSYPAAALLYDIKNAKAAKAGEVSIDDVGVTAPEQTLVEIRFEGKIDYDHFILSLTSVALAPLRSDITGKSDDWAKKPGTMVCSGPFRLARLNLADIEGETYMDANWAEAVIDAKGRTQITEGTPETAKSFTAARITDFTLERNNYYYRDPDEDDYDESVTPYRINVDCSLTPDQVLEQYKEGVLMYIGDVPLSIRNDDYIKENVSVSSTSMSTTAIYLNENALISDGGEGSKLFADAKVRQALSLAVDRAVLAELAVYADAATGLVPTGVWETGASKGDSLLDCSGCGIKYSSKSFRSACTATYEYLNHDLEQAKQLLSEAGVDASKYSFSLTISSYDDVRAALAEKIVEAWRELGFDVSLRVRGTIYNNDYYKYTENIPVDICDDLYAEALRDGDFEAILFDLCAYSVDPISVLAPFAKGYSGMATDMSTPGVYVTPTHITGYSNDEYDKLIESALSKSNVSDRANDLRDAEATLMEDLPVIPLIFNKTASLTNSGLEKLGSTYYVSADFSKATVKEYESYLQTGMDYITEHFDELQFNAAGKATAIEDGSYDPDKFFESFKKSKTIYGHFFQWVVEEATTPVATEADETTEATETAE